MSCAAARAAVSRAGASAAVSSPVRPPKTDTPALASSPPATTSLDAALRRVCGVLQARSCVAQQQQLSTCLAAPPRAPADDGGVAAAVQGRCSQYVSALHFCTGSVQQFSLPNHPSKFV